MSIHQLPNHQRKTHGAIHVWSDGGSGFVVGHESESGNSWGAFSDYSSGEAAIAAAFAMNRDQYGGVCAVHICDAARDDAFPGVGLVTLPGDI
jgi:hypothetical protein